MEESKFWELQKKYNLSLDNENYDDLMKFADEIEKMIRNEKNDLLPLVHTHYMRVGDEFHCLRCHLNYSNKSTELVMAHVEECTKTHPNTTYCDKKCGTNLLKNCHKCFKLLVLVPGETHSWYCPCSPDKFLSIG